VPTGYLLAWMSYPLLYVLGSWLRGTSHGLRVGPSVPAVDECKASLGCSTLSDQDNKGVLYLADQETDGVDELFATFDRLPLYLPLARH
jgi:hypothetical protein